MKMVERPISTLKGYDKNPRKNDAQVDRMVESIKEFGFRIPVVAKSDGSVVDGHLRLKAAQRMGMESVPVVLADELTDAQVKAFRLLANRSANWADWDEDLLRQELADLKDMDFDLSLTGFDAEEISSMLDLPLDVGGLTDPDEVPEPPVVPVTKPGDVWLLGRHRLMCGDSTSIDAVERLCDGKLVDMWLTDPPYNVAYEGGTKDKLTIQNDDMSDDQFRQFLRDCYVAADAVMKPGAVFYIWYADVETYNFVGAAKDAGWKISQILIWKKSSLILGRKDYHFMHEPCLYGWKDGARHLWAADRKQTTILEFDKPSRNGEHPTMKPVELFEYQMLNNTKGGDIVLDSFGGSGTTIIAAEKNGRVGYLMELDPKYCDVIVKRWEDFTGKKAVLETKSAVDSVGHN
ncbi:MAG: DNA modification methylase [Proteobacteria bacterium]|nr:DNA modification methylase [Pseudomonadota bacterium]